MGFRTLSDIVGIVVNVLHTDTIVERLTSVQPSDLKTSNRINKSIERFRVNVTLCIRYICVVFFGSEVPCLISITTNNVYLLGKASEIMLLSS